MSCEILEFLFYCSALSQGVVIILRGARQKIVSSSRESMFQMNLKKRNFHTIIKLCYYSKMLNKHNSLLNYFRTKCKQTYSISN
jgi:hypothetical protein